MKKNFSLPASAKVKILKHKDMGKLLDSLRDYFEHTPEDILKKDLEELEYLNEIGPDAIAYIENVREALEEMSLCSTFDRPTYSGEKYIDPQQQYYLAA